MAKQNQAAKMLVRLALENEAGAVVAMGRTHQLEAAPHLDYDPTAAHAAFRAYLTTASPTVFVAVDDDQTLIGFLVAHFSYYSFTSGHAITLETLYVRADKRTTEAAALLAQAFDDLASRTSAREVLAASLPSLETADASCVLLALGYEVVGSILRRIPAGP